MNKKAILILLAIMIACCICLAAVGILGFLFYAGNEFTTSQPDQDQAPTYYSTTTPTVIFSTPTVEIQPNVEEQSTYIEVLRDEMNLCHDTTLLWLDIEEQFLADLSLYNDEQAIDDYKSILEQFRNDCASLTVLENPPQVYENINDEVKLVNEYGGKVVDNFLQYVETQEDTYKDAGVDAGYEMSYHLEQITILIQEMPPVE